jgi:hypothetical protein
MSFYEEAGFEQDLEQDLRDLKDVRAGFTRFEGCSG